jgi:hypothetical protein
MWVIPEDLGNFSPKKGEKSWGAKICTSFSVEFSRSITNIISNNDIEQKLQTLTNKMFGYAQVLSAN